MRLFLVEKNICYCKGFLLDILGMFSGSNKKIKYGYKGWQVDVARLLSVPVSDTLGMVRHFDCNDDDEQSIGVISFKKKS